MERRLGAKLREIRKSRGHTQATLATALGISFQQVQKYESGINRISTSTLLLIAKTLNVPVYALLDVSGETATHRDLELILIMESLPEDRQRHLLQYARNLAN